MFVGLVVLFVRIEESLKARLEVAAAASGNTLRAEVEGRLEESFGVMQGDAERSVVQQSDAWGEFLG